MPRPLGPRKPTGLPGEVPCPLRPGVGDKPGSLLFLEPKPHLPQPPGPFSSLWVLGIGPTHHPNLTLLRPHSPQPRLFPPSFFFFSFSLILFFTIVILTYLPVVDSSIYIYFFLKKFTFFYLFIYDCVESSFLCEGLSPVAASGDHSSSRCAGLPLSQPLLLRSTGSRCAGSVIVAHGPSCSVACGIFPDRGSNPCPLHWQADSQPLRHQGSPYIFIFTFFLTYLLVS